MTISNERKQRIYDWLDTPLEVREPKSEREFRRSMRLGYRTFKNLRIEWQVDKTLENKRDVQLKGAYDAIEQERSSPINIAEEGKRWTAMETAIYNKGIEGTVTAQELYAKLKGKLIDKQEIKFGRLEDDDYYKIRNKARRELDARGDGEDKGDREVLAEPALLLEKPRLDTEQDNQEDD